MVSRGTIQHSLKLLRLIVYLGGVILVFVTSYTSLPLWIHSVVAFASHIKPHSHTSSGQSKVDCRSQMDQQFAERSEFKYMQGITSVLV